MVVVVVVARPGPPVLDELAARDQVLKAVAVVVRAVFLLQLVRLVIFLTLAKAAMADMVTVVLAVVTAETPPPALRARNQVLVAEVVTLLLLVPVVMVPRVSNGIPRMALVAEVAVVVMVLLQLSLVSEASMAVVVEEAKRTPLYLAKVAAALLLLPIAQTLLHLSQLVQPTSRIR